MITLSKLFVHPVKSMRGLQISHAQVMPSGLAFDRLFMLTDPQGTFITARQYPQLVKFTPALLPDGILITSPEGDYAQIRFSDFSQEGQPTEVWGNHFTALVAPDHINRWLSEHLQREVQLRWVGDRPTRRVKKQTDVPLSFADGYPYLLINEASLFDLKQRCPGSVKLQQFRPNLVVTGAQAYAEDTWKRIRVGDVEFELVKPCSRCVLTTVSVEKGRKHPDGEPLKTLQGYRTTDAGAIDFGQNLLALNSGVIRVGDNVEVLETQPAQQYGAGEQVASLDVPQHSLQSVEIDYRGTVFSGNNQQILLEQLEQQGLRIPYSCRAGICGSCKMVLEQGQVSALKATSIGGDGKILSCSCIPMTDLVLS
ncbi:YcbX family protein [Rouxiella sp. Mn2063]|uniref:YcbX family protein n=1 Tax=Rouxiella sp. Mn2063 TaxID=3395262 RepID=UPI003BCA26A8